MWLTKVSTIAAETFFCGRGQIKSGYGQKKKLSTKKCPPIVDALRSMVQVMIQMCVREQQKHWN